MNHTRLKPRKQTNLKRIIPAVLGAFFCFLLGILPACSREEVEDLNVVLISLDTLRPDHAGCYGHERNTSPNIDRLAKKGFRFETAVSAAPWTLPAQMSLFTSLAPSVHQVYSLYSQLSSDTETLAEMLKDQGFSTAAFTGGGFMAAEYGFGRGFDVYHENVKDKPELVETDVYPIYVKTEQWLRRNSGKRFFLFFHTFEPHTPYINHHFTSGMDPGKVGETLTIEDLRDLSTGKLTLNKEEIEYVKALYDGDIWYADRFVGEILSKIRKLGIEDKTIIIVTSDHGEDLWDHYPRNSANHGHSLYDDLVRIPLIIFHPKYRNPRMIKSQVRIVDVLPTILDFLNIPAPRSLSGTSLVPWMKGEETGDLDAYSEAIHLTDNPFHDFGPERKSIRTGDYKYIFAPDLEEKEYRGRNMTFQKRELFNLSADRQEKNNLVLEEPNIAEELHQKVEAFMVRRKPVRLERQKTHITPETRKRLKALGYIQ